MEEKIVKYSLTADDYVEYNNWLLTENDDFKKKMFRQRLLVAGFVIAIGILYMVMVQNYYLVTGVVAIICAGVLYALFPKMIKAGQKRAVLNYIQNDKEKQCFWEQEVAITENGLTIRTAQVQKDFKYSEVSGVLYSAHLFYIQLKDGQLIMIPTRIFDTGAERESFIEHIEKQMD